MNNDLLRKIPRVDDIMKIAGKDSLEMTNPSLLLRSSREVLDELRKDILEENITEIPKTSVIAEMIRKRMNNNSKNSLCKVINGTGITLHTNLGRSVIDKIAAQAAYDAAVNYTNLEYDLETGNRGSRYSHVEKYICEITGCEAAVAVNNNAAAVMLIMHALGYGKNMVISRGELVEIGGSFRIPSVMEIAGVTLREVGCTNRTHIADYENAIDENTAAILKVHQSNFVIKGFTEDVNLDGLHKISKEKSIPLIYDLGSGDVEEIKKITGDYDLLCFSGDKLLGGPQSGIICGCKKYIDLIKKDNLIRTLRLDKMTLAALEVTLQHYILGEEQLIPTVNMLNMTVEQMEEKYNSFVNTLYELENVKDAGTPTKFRVRKVITTTKTGGGSRPEEELSDVCISLKVYDYSEDELALALRKNEPPIIGRISEGEFLLSMRTIFEDDFTLVAQGLMRL